MSTFSKEFRCRTNEVLDALNFDEQGKRVLWRLAELWGLKPLELMGNVAQIQALAYASYQTVADVHEDWKWPRWMRCQMDPNSPGYEMKGAANKQYRTWTAVGSPKFPIETYVGVWGEITPGDRNKKSGWLSPENRFSLTFWIYDHATKQLVAVGEEGKITQRLRAAQGKKDDVIPIVETVWRWNGLEMKQSACAADVEGINTCLVQVTLSQSRRGTKRGKPEAPRSLTLFAAVRPIGPVYFSPIFEMEYSSEQGYFQVQDRLAVVLDRPFTTYSCSNLFDGDVCVDARDGVLMGRTKAQDELGYCTGAAGLRVKLRPDKPFVMTVAVPVEGPKPSEKVVSALRAADFDHHARECEKFWLDILSTGTQLRVNDATTTALYKTALVNLYIMRDAPKITPGPGIYHGFWIRDAGMFCNTLDKWGHHDTAEPCLDVFVKVQQPDGYFFEGPLLLHETKEWDFNGIAMWALYEHYLVTRRLEWLEKTYPALKKGVEFIANLRKETKADGRDALHYGLLTPSRSEEAWGMAMDYYYWDDFWSIRGIRYAEQAARLLGKGEDAAWLNQEASDLEECLMRSIERVTKKERFDFIPVSPYRALDSAIIGSIAALYPCRILSPDDPRVVGTQRAMLKHFMRDGLYFLRVVYGTLTALHTCSVAHAAVYMDDADTAVRVFRDIERWASPTHCWPEGASIKTGEGAQGDMPQNYAGAEYLLLLRDMVLYEEGDRLKITPAIPSEWVASRQGITFENAPTFFGTLTIRVTSNLKRGQIRLQLSPSDGEPPEGYVWFPRHPGKVRIARVTIDGTETKTFTQDRVNIPAGSRDIVTYFGK